MMIRRLLVRVLNVVGAVGDRALGGPVPASIRPEVESACECGVCPVRNPEHDLDRISDRVLDVLAWEAECSDINVTDRPAITWPGAGLHEGHIIRFVEKWEARVEDDGRTVTCGRVGCTCGASWVVGGWPTGVYDRIIQLEDQP